MKKLIIFCILAITALPAFAQPSDRISLPVQNRGVMKVYARSQGVTATLTIYSPAILPRGHYERRFTTPYQNTPGSKLVTGVDRHSLVNQISSHKPQLALTRVTDPFSVIVEIRNKDTYLLLRGETNGVRLVQQNTGDWRFYANAQARLIETLPIAVPSWVRTARVVIRNSEGQMVRDRFFPVQDGYALYPTTLAERPGEVILIGDDDRTPPYVINMETGERAGVWSQVQDVVTGIDGDYNFGTNPQNIHVFVPEPRGAVAYFQVNTPESRGRVQWGSFSTPDRHLKAIAVLLREENAPPDASWEYHNLNADGLGERVLPNGKWIAVYVFPGDNLDGVPIHFVGDDHP